MQIKSHFKFSRKQRSGILILVLLIIALQLVYCFVDFKTNHIPINESELKSFRSEVDSLKQLKLEASKPKLFPFNPNFITDHKGYTLGMSNEEIDRLLDYRKRDKWINSVSQFQQVTKVSDSLLKEISPYFKFPDWVTNPRPRKSYSSFTKASKPKMYKDKLDLNSASAEQLKKVNGIGDKLSERIIKERIKLGGFTSEVQLLDVYGLKPEVIERLKSDFAVKTPITISKLNLNTALQEDLVKIPHIDYEIAHYIIEQRILREGFKSLDELLKVKAFPINKFEIIKLYLRLQ